MKKIILTWVLAFTLQVGFSQEELMFKQHAVYLDNSGFSLEFGYNSLKYDFRFTKRRSSFGMAAGVGIAGFLSLRGWYKDSYRTKDFLMLSVPVELNYIYNIDHPNLFIDFAVGAVPFYSFSKEECIMFDSSGRKYGWFPYTHLGIRRQTKKNFFFFGLHAPLLFQISVGKTF